MVTTNPSEFSKRLCTSINMLMQHVNHKLTQIGESANFHIYDIKPTWFPMFTVTGNLTPCKETYIPGNFFFFDNPDLKEETFKFKLKLHGNFQTMEISKRKPTGKENLFPGNISRFALRHLPIHETPLLLLNLWRRTLNKCSWKIWKTGATYGRGDCVECKDFRNVGDLFHSLRPAKASFNPIFDNSKRNI